MLPPIIKTVRSPLPREELFEFFTLGLGNWVACRDPFRLGKYGGPTARGAFRNPGRGPDI
ncbi:hypothetical protein SAMN04488527_12632 [Aliiroseovarius crassostreae]|nr:hypothetical protein SAMN04488527_12632 [Aliiroseovarius crassostreae]